MMNKRILFLILFLVGCGYIVNAQSETSNRIQVEGRVSHVVTGEAIPFANIGVLGTVAGTASDMDGEFKLLLPKRYADYTIRFSVVGFGKYDIKVSDGAAQGYLDVKLQPISFKIDQVSVEAKSLVYIRMLKQAVENIGKNYINTPHSYVGYYEYKTDIDTVPDLSKEAIVTIYDSKGYERSDVETTFKQLNYTFTEVRRSAEPRSVYDKLTYFDDILTADVVRNTRNVLDIANIESYTLINRGKILYEGDSVQMIGYEIKDPTISTTGEANVTKYSGCIYINLTDYAILKNEMAISASGYTYLGRNILPVGGVENEHVETMIVTHYKKLHSKYFVSGININYTYQEAGKKVNGKMNYVTTRINTDSPNVINGRLYYEEVKANPRFWNAYTVYFEE